MKSLDDIMERKDRIDRKIMEIAIILMKDTQAPEDSKNPGLINIPKVLIRAINSWCQARHAANHGYDYETAVDQILQEVEKW